MSGNGSGFDVKLTIKNIREAQNANLQAIAALEPDGEFGDAIRDATVSLHRYAVSITHVGKYKKFTRQKVVRYRWARPGQKGVGGGALRASHRMEVTGLQGHIFIDPDSVNPRTGAKPSVYGVYEHQHGGAHAFYDRTVNEYGNEAMAKVANRVAFAVVK